MATKKKIVDALARKTAPDSLALAGNDLHKAFSTFSAVLGTMTTEQMPTIFSMIKKYATLADELKENVRNRVLTYVLENGERKTEKGTMVAFVSGYALECQPSKTGTDPKKLEGLLRAKGLDPVVAMDAKITYLANDGKVADAVKRGVLTQGEVDACRYDPTYRVMEPQKAE